MQLLNDKIDGSGSPENVLPAVEWNQLPSEIQNIITALGMTLSNGDLNQLGKALAGYAANGSFFTDSGAANAYVLTAVGGKQVHPDYEDGDEVEFIAANPSTGASTVNVAGKGVKNIKMDGGGNPPPGAISGRTSLKFDSGNNWFELIYPSSLYYQDKERLTAAGGGVVELRSDGNTDTENRRITFKHQDGTERGTVGFLNDSTLDLRNTINGGLVELNGFSNGGIPRKLIVATPDDDIALFDNGSEVAHTQPASGGGFAINNTATGSGFERALTTSDFGISGNGTNQFDDVTTADISYTNDSTVNTFFTTALGSGSTGKQYSGRLVLFGASAVTGTNPGLKLIVDPSGVTSGGRGVVTSHESLTGDVKTKKGVVNTEITSIPLGLTTNETMIVYEHYFSPSSDSQTVTARAAQSVSSGSFSRLLEGARWSLTRFN